jgi:hypothetical protein
MRRLSAIEQHDRCARAARSHFDDLIALVHFWVAEAVPATSRVAVLQRMP